MEGLTTDSDWPSFMLSHWGCTNGVFKIQEAIRKLTRAQVLGLTDRGVLRSGVRADANIINLDTVAERQPKLVHDFPKNVPQLIQKAVGYKATIVNLISSWRRMNIPGADQGEY
jgi:N-acyl-D-aspartate/D-glutamate deacylase